MPDAIVADVLALTRAPSEATYNAPLWVWITYVPRSLEVTDDERPPGCAPRGLPAQGHEPTTRRAMAQGRGGAGAPRHRRRHRRVAGHGQAVEHVRPRGADVLPLRARREGQGPPPEPHHRRSHGPLRGGEAGQLQGHHQALRSPRQPGVGPGVRLLQVPRPVQRPRGLPQGQGDARPRRLRRQGGVRPRRGAHAGAPRQPARAAVVPPRGAARGRREGAWGAHARRVDWDTGRRGVPGGVALRRRHCARRGCGQRAVQGVRVSQAVVPPRERDRGAGRAAAVSRARAGGVRQGAGGEPDPQDVRRARGDAEPAVERGPGVRRGGAVRGAAGDDGGGPGDPAQGRPPRPRPAAAHALREAARPPAVRPVPVVRPREVWHRRRHRGGDAAGAPFRQPRPRPRLPRGRVPRHGRVHHVHQRHSPHSAAALEAARRRARGRHPQRRRPAAHEEPRRPRHHRRLLRRQVRPEVGAHAHHAGHLQPDVERAVHVGGVRPEHGHHHRRLRQLPPRQQQRQQQRRRRGPGEGRACRQDPHPPLDAGDGPRVHARVPADPAAAVGGQEDGRAPARRAVHLPLDDEHGAPLHAAAAPEDALPAPVHGDAARRAPVPGDGHRGGAVGPRGAAAAAGGGGVHAGRGVPHVEHAAEQGQLLPRRVALLGRGRRGAVVRRRVPLEERGDYGAGARPPPHPHLVPGAHPPHRVPLHVHDRAVELPAPAAPPAAHGHQDVLGRGGAPGRARRGVRHVPDVAAAGRRVHAVRPAAERRRQDTDGGRRHGHTGGEAAVAAQLAGPQGDVPVCHLLPHRRGGALRHAVQGGGARRRAVPAPAPAVPQQAASRAQQLLPAAAVAGRQHALNEIRGSACSSASDFSIFR